MSRIAMNMPKPKAEKPIQAVIGTRSSDVIVGL
jgi:hypothetical protein